MATFSRWRRERPFWGSALAIIAGLEIYSAAAAPISVMAMQGLPGLLTLCVSLVAVIMGAVTLFQPVQRIITGWVVLVLGPISILATNLGGFVVGMIMLVVGGALILSWQPVAADVAGADAPATVTSPLVPAQPGPAQPTAVQPVEPVQPAPVQPVEPAQPVEPVRAEVGYGIPEPASAGTAPRDPDEPEPTRNPWRSRTTSAVQDQTPEPAPEPAPEAAPEPDPEPEAAHEPGTDATRPAGTRSWFGSSDQLSPMEPPKNLVRTTLLVPLILVSIAASGMLAAPAAQAGTADFPCLIPALCPSPTPEPSAAPSATPSPAPSPGITLPTLPDLLPGGDEKSTDPAKKDPDLAGAGDCPAAAEVPAGTTSGGKAAVEGAAAVQACQKAGETATVSAQEATGNPPEISNTIAVLKADRLEMSDFTYDGIKTLNSPKGPVRVLAFSLSKLNVDGMDQANGFGAGANNVRIANTDSRVVISGDVKLYVTSMTGKVLGLINLTFTPDFAPPLVLPSMFFTETTSDVALVQANKITLPNLNLTAK